MSDKKLEYLKWGVIGLGVLGSISFALYIGKKASDAYDSAKQAVGNAIDSAEQAASDAGNTVQTAVTDSSVAVTAAKNTAEDIVSDPLPYMSSFIGPATAVAKFGINLLTSAYNKVTAPICDGVLSPMACVLAGVETPVAGQNSYRVINNTEAGIVACITILNRLGWVVYINGDGWFTKVGR